MNKPFENTFDVKFDEKAMKTFNDLIKEKGVNMDNQNMKEILDGLNVVIKQEGSLEFDFKECKKILDYITNLQQQLDKYKNVIDKIKEYIHHEYFKREQLGIVDKTFYAGDMKCILELLEEVE